MFVFAVTLLYVTLGYQQGPVYLSLVIAFAAAVLAGYRALTRGSIVVGWALFLWLPPAVGAARARSLLDALALAAWLLVLLVVCEAVRGRRERMVEDKRRRELQARRRADEERLRIARELHDVLAHNISLINVQSGVALHLLEEHPEQARSALSAINEASADALREVRSVLGVLRGDGEQPPRAPTAGLASIDDLVSRARTAGLAVSLQVDGDRRPLPTSVDLAAFRIVQESLTNVVRHAGAGTVSVQIDYGSDALTVQIDDDGNGGAVNLDGDGGSGIPGMRERAAALGGDLQAGAGSRRRVPRACEASDQGRRMIRVLIADDQELVRAGFHALVDSQPDLEVVGEADDGRQAVVQARELRSRRRPHGYPHARARRARRDP